MTFFYISALSFTLLTVSSGPDFFFFFFFLKVWWHAATLFYLFLHKSSRHTMFIYPTPRIPSCCPHGYRSVEGLLWGAEPRLELGPALQQADALLYEPRHKLELAQYLPSSEH
jgi:hypothetical protein